MFDKILAWHFLNNNKLRTGEDAPADGVELRYEASIQICESGLHASADVRAALSFAPGCTLCRVECADVVTKHTDKFVCRSRTILWRIESAVMRNVLIWFAFECAARAKQYSAYAATYAAANATYAAAYAAADAAAAAANASATYAATYAYAAAAYAAANAAAYAAAYAAYAAANASATYAAEKAWQSTRLLELIEIARTA